MKLTKIQVADGPIVKVEKLRYKRLFMLKNDKSNVFGTIDTLFATNNKNLSTLFNMGSTIKELSFDYFGILAFGYLCNATDNYFDILVPLRFIDKLKLYNDQGDLINIQEIIGLLIMTTVDSHGINNFNYEDTYKCCRNFSSDMKDDNFIDTDIKLENYEIKADIKELNHIKVGVGMGKFVNSGKKEKVVVLRCIATEDNVYTLLRLIIRALLALMCLDINRVGTLINNKICKLQQARFKTNSNKGYRVSKFSLWKLERQRKKQDKLFKLYEKAKERREKELGNQ